jgi:hypothetical protein
MRKQALVLVVLVGLLGTGAKCDDDEVKAGVQIAKAALTEFSSATNLRLPKAITLDDSEIKLLAQRAEVPDATIRAVAPELDTHATWKSSITKLREIYAAIPEEVRSATISIACDAVEDNTITVEEVANALVDALRPTTDADVTLIAQTYVSYYLDMTAALNAGDEQAAAVTLACYVADQAS